MPASDYLVNKLLDFLFRAQAYSPPATVYVGLYKAAPTNAGGGTEVTGGSYARVAILASLLNWSGTQGAGTTAASSGTTALISNNGIVMFPAPTAAWGTVTHFGFFDALSGGNLLAWNALTTSKVVANGDAATSFPAGSLSVGLR